MFQYGVECTYLCCSQLLQGEVLELEQPRGKNVGKAISQLQEGCTVRTPLSIIPGHGQCCNILLAWATAGEHTFCTQAEYTLLEL